MSAAQPPSSSSSGRSTTRSVLMHLFGGGSASPAKQRQALEARRARLAIPLPDTAVVFFNDMCADHREAFAAFPLDGDDCKEFVLGPAEEEHMAAARELIPQLGVCERLACSGALGPGSSGTALTRRQFWFVYFTLLKPFNERPKPRAARPGGDGAGGDAQQAQIVLPHVSLPQALSLVPRSRRDGYLSCALHSPFAADSVAHTAFLNKAIRKSVAAQAFMERHRALSARVKDDIIHQCPKGMRKKSWAYLLGCQQFAAQDPACFDDALKELNARKQAAAPPPPSQTPPPPPQAQTTTTTTTAKEPEEPPMFGAQAMFRKSDYAGVASMKDEERGEGWAKWGTVLELLAMEWGAGAPLVFLPDFVAMLVAVLDDPALAYVGATLLLADSALHSTTFAMTQAAATATTERLEACIYNHAPRLSAHMKALWLDTATVAGAWFERLFVGAVPLATALRFCDCLLCDGAAAYLRIALSILQRFEEELLSCATAEQLTDTLAARARTIADPDEIIAIAYTIPLDPHLTAPDAALRSHDTCATDTTAAAAVLAEARRLPTPYLDLTPPLSPSRTRSGGLTPPPGSTATSTAHARAQQAHTTTAADEDSDEECTHSPSKLLTPKQFGQLNRWLPPRYSLMEPVLLYATATDGYNLASMLERVEGNSPLIVVVETTEHNVFGCFVPGQLYASGEHFYGTGEAFLFTFAPKPMVYEWRPGRNQFFFMVHNKTMAIGGGGQGPGLWVDGDLNNGQTHRSATFCNAPLNNGQTDFVVHALEVFTYICDD